MEPHAATHDEAARGLDPVPDGWRKRGPVGLVAIGRALQQAQQTAHFDRVAQHAIEDVDLIADVVDDLDRRGGLGEQHRGCAAEQLDITVMRRQMLDDPRRDAPFATKIVEDGMGNAVAPDGAG